VITLDKSAGQWSLGSALARAGISEGVKRRRMMMKCAAIVLVGSANGFSGGADVKEFGTPLASAAPNLRALVSEIEESSIARHPAIAGIAMGGGLELALGLPLSRGAARRAHRAAGGQTRSAAGGGRHAAPAAGDWARNARST